jgi:hypothetical protein
MDKKAGNDREGIPLQRVGNRRIKRTKASATPDGRTFCFADGRLGCPAPSAVHADRLVNTAVRSVEEVPVRQLRIRVSQVGRHRTLKMHLGSVLNVRHG